MEASAGGSDSGDENMSLSSYSMFPSSVRGTEEQWSTVTGLRTPHPEATDIPLFLLSPQAAQCLGQGYDLYDVDDDELHSNWQLISPVSYRGGSDSQDSTATTAAAAGTTLDGTTDFIWSELGFLDTDIFPESADLMMAIDHTISSEDRFYGGPRARPPEALALGVQPNETQVATNAIEQPTSAIATRSLSSADSILSSCNWLGNRTIEEAIGAAPASMDSSCHQLCATDSDSGLTSARETLNSLYLPSDLFDDMTPVEIGEDTSADMAAHSPVGGALRFATPNSTPTVSSSASCSFTVPLQVHSDISKNSTSATNPPTWQSIQGDTLHKSSNTKCIFKAGGMLSKITSFCEFSLIIHGTRRELEYGGVASCDGIPISPKTDVLRTTVRAIISRSVSDCGPQLQHQHAPHPWRKHLRAQLPPSSSPGIRHRRYDHRQQQYHQHQHMSMYPPTSTPLQRLPPQRPRPSHGGGGNSRSNSSIHSAPAEASFSVSSPTYPRHPPLSQLYCHPPYQYHQHLKRRRRLTIEESEFLLHQFAINERPTAQERELFAKHLRLDRRTIQVWFQNRRAKIKRDEKGEQDGVEGEEEGEEDVEQQNEQVQEQKGEQEDLSWDGALPL
ncbi:hypothetical protein EDD11_000337 [Mortierella claussenii]|nr:hypothetical protein EDD11_000337 [Mortierella claussenii]